MNNKSGLFRPDRDNGLAFWQAMMLQSAGLPYRDAIELIPLRDERGEHWLLSRVGDDWLLTCAMPSDVRGNLRDAIRDGLDFNTGELVELVRQSDCANIISVVACFTALVQDGKPAIRFNYPAGYCLGTVTLQPRA